MRGPETLLRDGPGNTLLLAWNLVDEIVEHESRYRALEGSFIHPIPLPRVL